MLLRVGGHAHAEVRRQAVLDRRVQVLPVVQAADHRHQFRAVAETVGLRHEEALPREGVAAQGHHVADA